MELSIFSCFFWLFFFFFVFFFGVLYMVTKKENHIPNAFRTSQERISAGLAIVTLEVPFWPFRKISLNNAYVKWGLVD